MTLRILPPRQKPQKLGKYVQDNSIRGISGKTNSDGEVMYRDLEKGVYLFVQTQKNTNWQSSISK